MQDTLPDTELKTHRKNNLIASNTNHTKSNSIYADYTAIDLSSSFRIISTLVLQFRFEVALEKEDSIPYYSL